MRAITVMVLFLMMGIGLPLAGADEIDRLVRDATSGSPQVRQQALKALGQSGDLRALQPLLAALRDDEPTIRDCAIAALQALARGLKAVYHTVAVWVEELLISLGVTSSPSPPAVEWTRHGRWV